MDVPVAEGLDLTCIKGGNARENARIIRQVFNGDVSPRRRTVVLNAGVGLFHVGAAADYMEGMEMAGEAISSGRAMKKLEQLIELSNKLK